MQLHLAVEIGRVGKEGAGDAAAWHAPRQRLHLDDMAPPEVAIHQHVLPWTWRLSGCRMLLMPFMLVGAGGWHGSHARLLPLRAVALHVVCM